MLRGQKLNSVLPTVMLFPKRLVQNQKKKKKKKKKKNRCVSYSHAWGVQRQNRFGSAPPTVFSQMKHKTDGIFILLPGSYPRGGTWGA